VPRRHPSAGGRTHPGNPRQAAWKAATLAGWLVVAARRATYPLAVVTDKRILKTPAYEAPTLKVVGTVHELTLGGCKAFNGSDGFYLQSPAVTLGSC
jgi:hypothetical protein